jgi:hypothetical protein
MDKHVTYNEGNKDCIQNFSRKNLKERENLGDLDVDGLAI